MATSEAGALYADYVLPVYNSEPLESEIIPGKARQQDSYGTTYIDRWTMNDEAETGYKIMRCLSNNPQTNVWIVKDLAWSMQPEGIPTDEARKMMELGFNVLVKGPEIGSSIPLSQSAYNTLKIVELLAKRGDMDASHIAIEGYSRGAMVAFGTNAYAEQFGIKPIYSNLTDPCVGLPIKVLNLDAAKKGKLHKVFDRETLKKGVALPLDITLLGLAVAKGMTDKTRAEHFLRTIDASRGGAVQFYRTGKPLMTGEAGMMAARTPLDMFATIAFFRQCRVNDKGVFKQIMADRPGVRFVEAAAGHGGGLDKRIISNIAMRFGRLGNQLAEGRRPEELDYNHILYGIESEPMLPLAA